MSVNSTLYYTNYTDVNDFNVHFYYTYVHPVATLMATLVNVVCAIVFAQKDLLKSGAFFQYSLVNSLGAALGMFILSGLALTRCGPLCPEITTYFNYETQAYELYGLIYVCNSLYCGGSLIQIAISIQLYLSITQKHRRLGNIAPVKVVIVFTVAVFSLGLAVLFSFKISTSVFLTISTDGVWSWQTVYHTFLDSSNRFLSFFSLFFIIISNKIFLLILIITNILLYIELRKIMKRKMLLTKSSNASSTAKEHSILVSKLNSITDVNMTAIETLSGIVKPKRNDGNEESKKKTLVMVLWVSIVFSSSRLVYALANLILLFMEGSVFNWWGSAFNFFYGACVYISYFFVYMKTNKLFRKKFYKIFLRKDVK